MSDLKTTSNLPNGGIEPDQFVKLLEIELIQKRAEWKKSSERSRNIRLSGFIFLFLLIAGAIAAFIFLMSEVNQRASTRENKSSRVTEKATP